MVPNGLLRPVSVQNKKICRGIDPTDWIYRNVNSAEDQLDAGGERPSKYCQEG